MVKISHFHCREHVGSIPGWGTKIPQACEAQQGRGWCRGKCNEGSHKIYEDSRTGEEKGRAGATPYRKIREGLSEKLTLELRPG